MPETYKDHQIETLFNPKTNDDRTIVHLLKAMDSLALNHGPSKDGPHSSAFCAIHGGLAGMAVAIATRGASTFDSDFVDRLTDRMGDDFLSS